MSAPLNETKVATLGHSFEAGDLSGFDAVKDFGYCERRNEFGHFPKGHP